MVDFVLQVPSYYALILRSLVVLEGLALSADQEYKLLAKAYPYMAGRLLTDPQPELRETFKELMLKDGRFRWNRLINLATPTLHKLSGHELRNRVARSRLPIAWFQSQQGKCFMHRHRRD